MQLINKKYQHTIIGSGFVGKNFKKIKSFLRRKNIVIYAAGVSNSKTKNKLRLNREFKTVKKFKKYIDNKIIVYISTCSIKDNTRNKSFYVKNKIKIENFIKNNFKKFHNVLLNIYEKVY